MKSVLIPIAPGSEELETVTLVDLLRRAGVEVVLASLDGQPVRCSRGTTLLPDVALDAVLSREFDMIALPGGQPGTNNLKADARIITLIQQMARQEKFVTAICAAPSVLASAGVLSGRQATSFPGALDNYPDVLRQPHAVVIDGPFITSRGPGTAMDFALTLIEHLLGQAKRNEVEAGLVRA